MKTAHRSLCTPSGSHENPTTSGFGYPGCIFIYIWVAESTSISAHILITSLITSIAWIQKFGGCLRLPSLFPVWYDLVLFDTSSEGYRRWESQIVQRMTNSDIYICVHLSGRQYRLFSIRLIWTSRPRHSKLLPQARPLKMRLLGAWLLVRLASMWTLDLGHWESKLSFKGNKLAEESERKRSLWCVTFPVNLSYIMYFGRYF